MHAEYRVTRDVEVVGSGPPPETRRYREGDVVYFVDGDDDSFFMEADGWWGEFPEGSLEVVWRAEAGESLFLREGETPDAPTPRVARMLLPAEGLLMELDPDTGLARDRECRLAAGQHLVVLKVLAPPGEGDVMLMLPGKRMLVVPSGSFELEGFDTN